MKDSNLHIFKCKVNEISCLADVAYLFKIQINDESQQCSLGFSH